VGQPLAAQLLMAAPGTSALTQAARTQGFSHAVVMDPSCLVAGETSSRALAFLALARADGVAMMVPTEKWFIRANGLTADRSAKPDPLYRGTDPREPLQIARMECRLAELDAKVLLLQQEFLALALQRITAEDKAVTTAEFDEYLRLEGLHLHHLIGVVVDHQESAEVEATELVMLQHVIYPKAGLGTEAAMFHHTDGPLQNFFWMVDQRASAAILYPVGQPCRVADV
jgi:hypothetical protein